MMRDVYGGPQPLHDEKGIAELDSTDFHGRLTGLRPIIAERRRGLTLDAHRPQWKEHVVSLQRARGPTRRPTVTSRFSKLQR